MKPRQRLEVLLVLASIGVGCGHAPPVPEAPPVPPAPVDACAVSGAVQCRPFGNCSPEEVVGAVCSRTVRQGDSLIELARQYDLGFNEIAAANPGVDPFVPPQGSGVTIPNAFILPRTVAPGTLVINLSEMRLYLFPRSPGAPMTFPVGVGSEGWETPVGNFTVVKKEEHPTWYPPLSIRRENPALPATVPPGPDNPLGSHALRLSRGSILIHGTNTPFAVGRKASHGCLRLYPEDIPHLYEWVPLGTRVVIVREPVKVGLRMNHVYVEAHEDADSSVDYLAEAKRLLSRRGLLERVDPRKLAAALNERKGYPVDVSMEEQLSAARGVTAP